MRLENVEENVHEAKLYLENDIDVKINILVENYVPAAKRYESASKEIENIKTDLDVVKKTVAEHSEILKALA